MAPDPTLRAELLALIAEAQDAWAAAKAARSSELGLEALKATYKALGAFRDTRRITEDGYPTLHRQIEVNQELMGELVYFSTRLIRTGKFKGMAEQIFAELPNLCQHVAK